MRFATGLTVSGRTRPPTVAQSNDWARCEYGHPFVAAPRRHLDRLGADARGDRGPRLSLDRVEGGVEAARLQLEPSARADLAGAGLQRGRRGRYLPAPSRPP